MTPQREISEACTFGVDHLGGELQALDVLSADVLQGDGQLLGLSVEQL